MKVIEKVGSARELARILGCSHSYISNWVHGYRKVPIKYVKKLVELSGGQVKKKDLRPDIYDD
jgi:DNA-binding transcriptional regulator YdaS (Cro superfamily)